MKRDTIPVPELLDWDDEDDAPTEVRFVLPPLERPGEPEPLGDVVARVLADAVRGER